MKERLNKMRAWIGNPYSLFIRLLFGFLMIVLILTSVNVVSLLMLSQNNKEKIINYNQLLLNNAAEAYENQLSTIQRVLFNLYFDENTATLNVKLGLNMMDRLDYLKASQLSGKIETSVENPAFYLDNILLYYPSPSYTISKGGSSESLSLFSREYNSDVYPAEFWQEQLKETYEYQVFESDSFIFSSGYSRELIPIVLKMTSRNYMAIAFLDAGRMIQSFHQVPDSELAILNKEGQLIHYTSPDWLKASLIETLSSGETEAVLHDQHYYFTQKGTATGFTYISSLPATSVSSQMSSINLTSALLLILSVCCGILVSIFYTRRMDAPVKEIVSSLAGNKPASASLSGNIAEFKLIHNQITDLIQEKNAILSDLVQKKALLTNYNYIHKVKRIKSDLSERSDTITEQPYRLMLFQLNYKKSALKQHKLSTEQIAYALKEYIELAISPFERSHTLQIENDQILTMINGEIPLPQLEKTMQQLKLVFDRDTPYCLVTMALSRIYPPDVTLGDAYDEVLEITKTAKLVEETQLLTYSDTAEPEYHPFLAEKDQEFYMNLQAGNASMCIELVHRMLDYLAMKEESALRFRQFSEQIIETTLQVIALNRMEIEDQTELHNSIGMLDDCYTIDQLKHFFSHFITLSCSLIQTKKEEQNDTTDGAMSYLEEHYSEDISLDIVAGHLGITGAYLSALMKEKTGVNFSDHLNNIRIRKAKELLDSTDLSIQEIGQRIGYRNVTSFIRMFKKLTTMTPGDYRKKGKLSKL